MMPNWKTLNKEFRLNGLSCSWEDLKYLGYAFVKEGEAYEKAIGNFLLDWSDAQETIQVNTSGSTGKPKPILLKKEHMVNSALTTGEYFNLKSGNKALLCLSAENIAGKMMLVRAMVMGLHLRCIEPSSRPMELLSKSFDFCAMVPMQLENSLDKINQIKTVIVGGASVSNALKEKIHDADCQVFETYGMTETITHVAVKRLNNVRPNSHPELVEGVSDSPFKALSGIRFSKDKRDCLVIDAPKITDGPIVTNDVVDLISESEFEWLGRYDNVINSGGLKLFPEQIEAKLSAIISNRFFVTGFPDQKLGQKLVLIVEGKIDTDLLSEKMAVLSSLGKYQMPKSIYRLLKFLETETGKIRRKETLNLL